jgi:hypothetical protein
MVKAEIGSHWAQGDPWRSLASQRYPQNPQARGGTSIEALSFRVATSDLPLRRVACFGPPSALRIAAAPFFQEAAVTLRAGGGDGGDCSKY